MKKMFVSALFATVAGALTFGAAASLNVTSQTLGSGSSAVTSCDTDGVTVVWGLATEADHGADIVKLAVPIDEEIESSIAVTRLIVRQIDEACEGLMLNVALDLDGEVLLLDEKEIYFEGNGMREIVMVTPGVDPADVTGVTVTIGGSTELPSGAGQLDNA